MSVALELCISSVDEIDFASQTDCAHIELCSALGVGGLTPSPGLVSYALDKLGPSKVRVLIRPIEGSFDYAPSEVAVMKQDIAHLAQMGVRKFVIGMLNQACSPELDILEELIVKQPQFEWTFHRAIDLVPEPHSWLEKLKNIGIGRVLSSGGAPTAMEGIERLAKLNQFAQNLDLCICPASGVNAANCVALIQQTGCAELHFSMRKERAALSNLFEGGYSLDTSKYDSIRKALINHG